jgi:hypothetical protein
LGLLDIGAGFFGYKITGVAGFAVPVVSAKMVTVGNKIRSDVIRTNLLISFMLYDFLIFTNVIIIFQKYTYPAILTHAVYQTVRERIG